MIYIGSGTLRRLIEDTPSPNSNAGDWIIVGRRLKNISRPDIKIMRGNNCLFLDTVDLESVAGLGLVTRLRWLFHPYRLEKSLTYLFLRLIAGKVIQLHVPVIVDSKAWQAIETEVAGIQVTGLTYESIIPLILNAIQDGKKRYTSQAVYQLCRDSDIPLNRILVQDCLSARLLEYASD